MGQGAKKIVARAQKKKQKTSLKTRNIHCHYCPIFFAVSSIFFFLLCHQKFPKKNIPGLKELPETKWVTGTGQVVLDSFVCPGPPNFDPKLAPNMSKIFFCFVLATSKNG
jgi:hypothetical protein